jgi:hypothetical protein
MTPKNLQNPKPSAISFSFCLQENKSNTKQRTMGGEPSREREREEEEEAYLFELIQDLLRVGQVPVGEQFIDDSQILPRLGEPREEPIHITLGLLFDDTTQALEEADLSTGSFAAAGARTGEKMKAKMPMTMTRRKAGEESIVPVTRSDSPCRGSCAAKGGCEGARLQKRTWGAGALLRCSESSDLHR